MANLKLNNVVALSETGGVATFGTSSSTLKYPAGHILQCLSVSKLNTFSFSGDVDYHTVTGLTQAITPSSTSNKILLQAQLNLSVSSANASNIGVRFAGGNSATYIGNADASQQRAALHLKNESTSFTINHFLLPTFTQYLDAPATISEVTYEVQVRVADGAGATGNTVFVNRGAEDSDNAQHGRGASSLTVWEVQV